MANLHIVPDPTKSQELNAVYLTLTIRRFGTRAKMKTAKGRKESDLADTVEDLVLDGEVDAFHLSKDLLKSPEYQRISARDTETRVWLRRRTLPSLVRDGVHLLTFELIDDVDAYLLKYIEERHVLVDAFLEAYPERVLETKERLGANFNQGDYPPADAIRHQFKVEYSYIQVEAPGKIATFRLDIYRREQEKAAAQMDELVASCKAILRAELKGMVDHLVHRLTPWPDGKRKLLFSAMIPNFAEGLALIKARDIASDADLQKVLVRAEKILAGVDIDSLRDDEGVRDHVRVGFERVKKLVDGLVTEAPRLVCMGDEE